jgi:hypothetical protein
MTTDDFNLHVIEINSKFEYAYAGLCFAALALSIQFSPAMGNCLPWLLVSSWFLLVLSSLIAGYRLMKQPVFLSFESATKQDQGRCSYRGGSAWDVSYKIYGP